MYQRNEVFYIETNKSLYQCNKQKNIIRKLQKISLNYVRRRESKNASAHNYKNALKRETKKIIKIVAIINIIVNVFAIN